MAVANDREELISLRRLAQLELKAATPKSKDLFSSDPTEGMTGPQKFFAGAGKGMTDVARGVGQITGLVSQQEIDDAKRRDAPLMASGAGLAGSVVGGAAATAPAAMLPGANTFLGTVLAGELMGALSPVASDESRLGKTMLGMGGAAAGYGTAKGLARMLSPKTDPAVRALMDEGVTPTPGQILGGTFNRAESAAQNLPFVGSGIREAKIAAGEEFNTAAFNRALSQIGKKSTQIGHEGVKEAEQLIGQAYDDAYRLVPNVGIDNQFIYGLDQVRMASNALTPERASQLNKILDDRVFGKIPQNGSLSGEEWGAISSQLKTLARQKLSDPDSDARAIGESLYDAANEIRKLIGRNDPDADNLLSKADAAYAAFARVRSAAAKKGAGEGIFSPSELGAAIRSADSSVGKRQIGRGEGLMQDLAKSGQSVLGPSMPDSGTAERAMWDAIFLGGAGIVNPKMLAAGLMARGAYTRPSQKVIASILANRPESLRSIGEFMSSAAPIAGYAGASATTK